MGKRSLEAGGTRESRYRGPREDGLMGANQGRGSLEFLGESLVGHFEEVSEAQHPVSRRDLDRASS